MAWTAVDIPDHTGRLAVVTGANGGLGLETTRELARKGAHVIMAARNIEKARSAEQDILTILPRASLEILSLDLGSLESVKRAAAQVLAGHEVVDLLVNNAGVMATPRRQTQDGFELQFGTNHLGHFALTCLLMPALLRAAGARVVTVTSTARHFAHRLNPDDPHLTTRYDPWLAYGRSKMANLHFAVELNRRLEQAGAGAISLPAHPGFSNTELQQRSVESSGGGWSRRFFHVTVEWFGMPPAAGALPQLRAATDPAARGGELYTPRWVNFGSPVRRPIMPTSIRPQALRNLWEVSERETGIVFDVAALVREAQGG